MFLHGVMVDCKKNWIFLNFLGGIMEKMAKTYSKLQSCPIPGVKARSKVNDHIRQAKCAHYQSIMDTNDQRRIFSSINTLMGKKNVSLPSSIPDDTLLCNRFAAYFQSKVSKIREFLKQRASVHLDDGESVIPVRECLYPMTALKPTNLDELQQCCNKSPTKSCVLDGLPTAILKDTISAHLPTLVNLINASFNSGIFPSDLKQAVITPVLKKPNLDKEQLNNYRPVSNLPFIGKLCERLAIKRLDDHFNQNNYNEIHQSAYKPFHSTETALVKVHHDIVTALGENQAVLLVLLDLSAAFDTVDTSRLIDVLEGQFGVTNTAKSWFSSYLFNRSQRVAIGSSLSNEFSLESGLPQGSVVGPILFNTYTAPLEMILKRHNVQYHKYADDIQVYTVYNPYHNRGLAIATETLASCIQDIRQWMLINRLKLNDDKTSFMHFLSPYHLNKFGSTSIQVGDTVIHSETQCKNLGVMFDCHLSMKEQVANICKKCHYHLRRIRYIRKYLTHSSCRTVVQALVISNLDYCNAILCNIPENQVRRLQRIQNSAARIISRSGKYEHITPILLTLHWLPVKLRIKFKVLVLIWKCLNSMSPVYLQNLISIYQRDSRLRKLTEGTTLCKPFSTKSAGHGAFGYTGPRLWNNLPTQLRQSTSVHVFRKQLKTELFRSI